MDLIFNESIQHNEKVASASGRQHLAKVHLPLTLQDGLNEILVPHRYPSCMHTAAYNKCHLSLTLDDW